MIDSQVDVPEPAAQRGGIQPVVTMTANGAARAEVAVGARIQNLGRARVVVK